jgi:hypothetical protein
MHSMQSPASCWTCLRVIQIWDRYCSHEKADDLFAALQEELNRLPDDLMEKFWSSFPFRCQVCLNLQGNCLNGDWKDVHTFPHAPIASEKLNFLTQFFVNLIINSQRWVMGRKKKHSALHQFFAALSSQRGLSYGMFKKLSLGEWSCRVAGKASSARGECGRRIGRESSNTVSRFHCSLSHHPHKPKCGLGSDR